MYNSNIKESQHDWQKTNLVTISGRGGRHYDQMECSLCKMKGKRYGFESVEVSENYKQQNVNLCPKAKEVIVEAKRVRVTRCTAAGKVFENMTSGSVHDIVDPPVGQRADTRGIWVMGVGEPIKLLNNEFVFETN